MKKIFSFAVLLALAVGAMAQSSVVRSGNQYLINGQTMNSREFKGYLQNTCPEAFSKFNSGYKTAIAGWVLFGGGLGLELGGIATSIASGVKAVESTSGATPAEVGGVIAGPLMYVTGALAVGSSIVCLAVGYARMHNTVDVYNVSCAKKPMAEFHLTSGANGVGIACQF